MESNTPNYAKWIPEAGGYVHNGTVVSKKPIYDNAGRQQIEVDITNLQTPKAVGTQENQANSGIDVNSSITNTGSLASLSENTANTEFGTINSPATKSNVAGQTVLSPLDQVNKDYEYMVATGNLKGQIDKLTQISQMTGADYSATIKDLWNQRSQKIQNEDNAYMEAIAEARASGNEDLAQQLELKRNLYRESVDYNNQMEMDRQNQLDVLRSEYVPAYLQGLNDITNGIMSQLNNMINFQYNPQMDLNLQVAQGYAVGAVKEQMNHTGMYYSSMTQNAIARAVAELVPVYEKMARDEIKDNISLLQNVGSYLMNLENMQLSIWEANLTMKFKENAERRAEINQAIENANARGYYTNEEAILLGVPAGTESYEARKRAEDKQDEIEREQRSLALQKSLANYKKDMDIELMREEYALKNSGLSGRTVQVTKTSDDGTTEYKYEIPYEDYIAGNGGEVVDSSVRYDDNGNIDTSTFNSNVQTAIGKIRSEDGTYSKDDVRKYLTSNEFKSLSNDDKDMVLAIIKSDAYQNKVNEAVQDFGSDYMKTTNALKKVDNLIKEYADIVKATGEEMVYRDNIKDLINQAFNAIDNSASFDYILMDWGDNDVAKSKAYAKSDIITSIEKAKDNEILNDIANDYQQLKDDAKNLYDTTTVAGRARSAIKDEFKGISNSIGNFFGGLFDTKTDAEKATSNLTESSGEQVKSDKKVYITLTPPDSSGYSVEEFAKRLGFQYDKKKGKAYYFQGDYPNIDKIYEKYIK